MKKAYGLNNIEFKPLSIGLQYKALDTGKIDVAAVFTTDAQLAGGKLTVLKDSKGIFGYQNVAPVVSKKVLAAQGPEFEATLNAVSAKLTNEAMQTMNGAVDLDKKKPEEVAKAVPAGQRPAVGQAQRRGAEPALAALRRGAGRRPRRPRRGDRDDDELGDAVAGGDLEGGSRSVFSSRTCSSPR